VTRYRKDRPAAGREMDAHRDRLPVPAEGQGISQLRMIVAVLQIAASVIPFKGAVGSDQLDGRGVAVIREILAVIVPFAQSPVPETKSRRAVACPRGSSHC